MRIDRRLLGWGGFLVIVGAIPLLVRGGYLAEEMLRPWPTLWPLLLIGWGLGLILRRTPGEVLGGAVSVVVLGIMGGGLIATGFGGMPAFGACGDGGGGTSFGEQSGTLSEPARVSIEFNCGSLNVDAVDGADWAVGGTGPHGRGPNIEAAGRDLTIARTDGDGFMGFGDAGSDWQVDLPRVPVVDLGVTLNAGDGHVNLGGANLGSVNLTLNAGAMTMDLAGALTLASVGVTVNAGSATLRLPGSVDEIDVTLNAGTVEVCLPAGTPLLVSWSGALGSNNFGDIGLIKVDDEHWTTGDDPLNPVDLQASANAGSFNLSLGGSCDA